MENKISSVLKIFCCLPMVVKNLALEGHVTRPHPPIPLCMCVHCVFFLPQLFSPEDMVVRPHVDELSMMAHLFQFSDCQLNLLRPDLTLEW